MSKKMKRCIYNRNGLCFYDKSRFFYKQCNVNCNKRTYYNSFYVDNDFKRNNNCYVDFLKMHGKLVLKIKIPIDYDKFRKVLKGDIWTFQCTKKDRVVTIQISIKNIESYIEFLFDGFDKNISVKSGCLYIFLDNVHEIVNNKIPYNQIKKKIKIKRTIKNDLGTINITISLDKDLVFLSVYKLFKNNNPKTININNDNTGNKNNKTTTNNTYSDSPHTKREDVQQIKHQLHVRAVVLSNNRKCIYENHEIVNITAIIRVAKNNGDILNISIPAVYCEKCEQYIILKSDYKSLKKKGALLCKVTDKTPEYVSKNKKSSYNGTESKVHSLGYNVIKQGYNYTFEQRKIILANIIENYNITQHEILSMLDTNISRKKGLPSYAEAIQKWEQDREFVKNYKIGYYQNVIVDEIIIGRRN